MQNPFMRLTRPHATVPSSVELPSNAAGRRYIVGTAKSSLRKFERELLAEDWQLVHEGLEVRITPAPGGKGVFILCRSAERQAKEQAMHECFEQRIEEGLAKIQTSCQKKKQKPVAIATRLAGCWGATHARPRCSM